MNKKILFIVISNVLISSVHAQDQSAIATSSKQYAQETAVGYQSLAAAHTEIKAVTEKPKLKEVKPTAAKSTPAKALAAKQLLLAATGSSDSGIASNAVNFSKNIGVNVNERTGQASLNINAIQLPGVSQQTGITLAINKSDNDQKNYFGLDDHWQWNVDYLETDATGQEQLHLAQGAQYQYDQNYNTLSGMRYYQLNDARLVQKQGSITLSDLADKPVRNYGWVFQGLDGTVKYFSNSGLLLAVQDKYGNSVLYSYDFSKGNTMDKAKLISIENAYAKVSLAYANTSTQTITLSLPDSRQYTLSIANNTARLSYPKLADGSILHTDINTIYNDDDKTVTINYPNGASKEILYTKIPYLVAKNTISAVSEVRDYVAADRSHYLETDYIYHGDGDDVANFSGYPQIQNLPPSCLQDPSADLLLSCTSGGNRVLAGFSYQTQVLKYSVQNNTDKQLLSKTVNHYNSLHLQTAQDNYIPHGSDLFKVSEDSSQYQAASNVSVNQLSVVYQLPTTKLSASCDPTNSDCTLNGVDSKNAFVSEQRFNYQQGDAYNTQPTSVTSLVQVNGNMQTQTKQETSYDLPDNHDFAGHYGLVESQMLSSCTDDSCSAGQAFDTQNSLSADHKYIQSSTSTGSNASSNLNLSVGALVNTPSRTTNVQQDSQGRTIQESMTEDHPHGMLMLAVNASDQADTSSVKTDYQQNGNEITIKETKNDDGTVTKVIDIRNGNLMQETDAQGHKTTYTYDALGRVLTENVPGHGSMSYYYQMSQQPNRLPTGFIEQGAQNISAQIKQAANGLEQFEISYMVNGQTVSKEGDNYDPATDSLKQDSSNPFADLTRITSTTYSNLQGQKIKAVDINGNVTSYLYDTANRQVEVDNPDGTKSITAYYADDNKGIKTEFSLAKNAKNAQRYDVSNVKVSQTDTRGNVVAEYSFSNEIFDQAKAKLDSGTYVANDYSDIGLVDQDVLKAIDSKANLLTQGSSVYDNFGNVIQSTDNDGVITSYDYDNIIYTTEDDNGHKQTHYGHMVASHSSYPKDVVDDKSLQAVSAYTMNYAYDMFDNTIEKSLSYDNSTPYVLGTRQYDVNDNLINESGNGIAISRQYDQNGNVIQKVLPYGAAGSSAHAVVCNQYDDVNNLTESDVYINSDSCAAKDSSKLEETLTWTYDPTTNELLSTTKSYGAAAKIKDIKPSTINYSYYKDGSLKAKTYPDGKTLSYVYNTNGSVKSSIDPFGMKTELSYNPLGQIISETFVKGLNKTEVSFKYNNWGQLTERDSGNIMQKSIFNDLGLLMQISNYFKGNLVNQFSFSYYNDGNLKQKTREDHINDKVGKSVENYVYDTMNNLQSYSCQNESASIGGNVNLCPRDQYGNIIASQDYTFDPFNNIKQEKSKFM